MNKRTSGRAFETWCRDWLIEQGWSVHLCGRKAMMIGPGKLITKGDDIFGCDLVAVRPTQKTLFIQCTMDSSVGKRLKEITKYYWNSDHQTIELWQKTKPGEVNIKRLGNVDFETVDFIDVGKIIRGKFYRKEGP